jgi:hypothetical protein
VGGGEVTAVREKGLEFASLQRLGSETRDPGCIHGVARHLNHLSVGGVQNPLRYRRGSERSHRYRECRAARESKGGVPENVQAPVVWC